jgi:hypothetical protein
LVWELSGEMVKCSTLKTKEFNGKIIAVPGLSIALSLK